MEKVIGGAAWACANLLMQVVGNSSVMAKGSWGFLRGSGVKNPPANSGDTGSIPGSRRSPEEGNGNPLQYSCVGNPVDRGA